MRPLPLSVWKARRTVVRRPRSPGACCSCSHAACAPFDHLARFLEEDVAHLVVVLEVADQGDRLHRRLAARGSLMSVEARRLGRGGDEVDQRLRSSPRAVVTLAGSSAALTIASCAFSTAAASIGWSAACASCDRAARGSSVTSCSGTSSRTTS